MNTLIGRLRKAVLGLQAREADFNRRGFRGGTEQTRARIEQIISTFIVGYNQALASDDLQALALTLRALPAEQQGFAFEAAAMALGLLDTLTPWGGDRLPRFIDGLPGEGEFAGPAGCHRYMAYIGYGLALARLGRPFEPAIRRLDPRFCWLVLDGYGFHEGFFKIARFVDSCERPRGFEGYALRAFDQGLGRSLWFVEGGNVERIPATIGRFEPARQPDLWSGAGLALAYAGGVGPEAVQALLTASGEYRAHLAQGIAFAAMTRDQAGNPAPQTELASRTVWRFPAEQLARHALVAMDNLPADRAPRDWYEVTRRRIQTEFAAEVPAP